jgi:hypothetical protein
MTTKITKEDEKKIDDFERLNGIKDKNYLFAVVEENNEIFMIGEVTDEFVFNAVMRILVDHPKVMAMILDDIANSITDIKMKMVGVKKDPNRKLN